MDSVVNFGIPYVADQIFENIKNEDTLIQCLSVSQAWKSFAENVLFKRWKGNLILAFTFPHNEKLVKRKAEVARILLERSEHLELNPTIMKKIQTIFIGCPNKIVKTTK